MDREIWRYGDMEIGRYEIGSYGMEIGSYGDREL